MPKINGIWSVQAESYMPDDVLAAVSLLARDPSYYNVRLDKFFDTREEALRHLKIFIDEFVSPGGQLWTITIRFIRK